jgi:hypothetical protein
VIWTIIASRILQIAHACGNDINHGQRGDLYTHKTFQIHTRITFHCFLESIFFSPNNYNLYLLSNQIYIFNIFLEVGMLMFTWKWGHPQQDWFKSPLWDMAYIWGEDVYACM